MEKLSANMIVVFRGNDYGHIDNNSAESGEWNAVDMSLRLCPLVCVNLGDQCEALFKKFKSLE